jgi:hypothetical protein
MASTFTNGTISQPDAGSLGLSMAEKIRDDVVAHPAWNLVEEFTPAGSPVRWYVLRCLAAQSGLPSDFYVVMSRVIATGELRWAICETYNAAGRVMSHFAYYNGTSMQLNHDAEGRHATTFTLGTVNFAQTNHNPHYLAWVPNSTSTKWWIIASEDRFTVAFNGSVNGFMHAGAFTPITSMPWLMPLVIMGSSTTDGSVTRLPSTPNAVNLYAYGWGVKCGGGGLGNVSGPMLGVQGALDQNDKMQGAQRPVAEQGMVLSFPDSDRTIRPVYGHFIGKQKGMRVGMASTTPAGMAFGDAYALQGRLWVPWHPQDPRIWDTGLAAS